MPCSLLAAKHTGLHLSQVACPQPHCSILAVQVEGCFTCEGLAAAEVRIAAHVLMLQAARKRHDEQAALLTITDVCMHAVSIPH